MAVREGFEPSIRLQTVYSLSRGAPSASRPPHHRFPVSYPEHFEKQVFFNQPDTCLRQTKLSQGNSAVREVSNKKTPDNERDCARSSNAAPTDLTTQIEF